MAATAEGAAALRFVVYSDYLCPWCANGAVRLGRIEQEYAGRVRFEWKSYLLRPQPRAAATDAADAARQLEKFRRYAESWRRPAAEDDAYDFRIWEGDASPPTHSMPAQVVAKAATERGGDAAFRRIHERLLRAYFHENRDISADDTLRALWVDAELAAADFPALDEPAFVRAVLEDHREAVELGATGVPAVRLEGNDAVIVGAHPVDLYRRWIERAEARQREESV